MCYCPEFISKVLDRWAYEHGVTLDFSRPGKPTDNAVVESLDGRLRDEWLNANWFLSLADTMDKLFERFDAALDEAGYLAKEGQIVDVTVIAAPRQTLTDDEKAVVCGGGTPPGRSKAKRRQKTSMRAGRSSAAA